MPQQKIYLYDPKASHEKVLDQLGNKKNIIFTQNKYDAIKDSKNLVLATEWKEFWQPDLNRLKNKVIFDGRNIYDHAYFSREGSRGGRGVGGGGCGCN